MVATGQLTACLRGNMHVLREILELINVARSQTVIGNLNDQ